MSAGENLRALPVGTELLWYRVESVLGQGGFGITYLATDTNLDQRVAIKEYLPAAFAVRVADLSVVPSSTDASGDFSWGLERFLDEGKTLAKFDHPGIVRVLSVFEQSGTAYLVMRYEDGLPFSAVIERDGCIEEARLKNILFEIIDGLNDVHAAGFIHRDIKPANIFIRENDSAVLIDFGAARLALGAHSQSLTAIVSPGYAPFEQYFSDAAQQGPWTDIYALGATAYRAIAGVAPMPAVDRSKTLLGGAPDSLVEVKVLAGDGYSAGFLAAIEASLAFRETDRPQSLSAWRALLEGEQAPRAGSVAASGVDAEAETEVATTVASGAKPASSAPPASVAASVSAATPTSVEPVATASPAEAAPPPATQAWYKKKRYVVPLVLFALLVLSRNYQPERTDGGTPAEPAGEAVATNAEFPPMQPAAQQQPDSEPESEPEPEPQPEPEPEPEPEPTVEPEPATQPGPATQPTQPNIEALLASANADFQALRLTTPKGRNALVKYRRVLELDPGNTEALAGLDAMVKHYFDKALEAADQRDFDKAANLIERAAEVDPNHPDVPRARKQLELRRKVAAIMEKIGGRANKIKDKRVRKSYDQAMRAMENGKYDQALKSLREMAQRVRSKRGQ